MKMRRKKHKSNFQTKRDVKPAKEVGTMPATVSLRESEEVFIREMNAYISRLKKQQRESEGNTKEEAKIALIRTGVLTEEGKEKENIVTWE